MQTHMLTCDLTYTGELMAGLLVCATIMGRVLPSHGMRVS